MTTTPPSISYENASAIAREKLARDLGTALDDAEELLRLTAAQTGERFDDVRGRLSESLARARRQIVGAQAELSAATRSMAAAAENCVRAHPWRSLGAASAAGAAAGLLLGMLIRQR
jgi:ElaB/YqjD/DUF883 family membrane-anchored ribosome-binding protein